MKTNTNTTTKTGSDALAVGYKDLFKTPASRIVRKRKGNITLNELRKHYLEIMGGAEVIKKNPESIVIWNALRMGVDLAQKGKLTKQDSQHLRNISNV